MHRDRRWARDVASVSMNRSRARYLEVDVWCNGSVPNLPSLYILYPLINTVYRITFLKVIFILLTTFLISVTLIIIIIISVRTAYYLNGDLNHVTFSRVFTFPYIYN